MRHILNEKGDNIIANRWQFRGRRADHKIAQQGFL